MRTPTRPCSISQVAPRRWIKTNPAGWFGFDAPACLDEQVVLVEGGFDRLVLLAAGLPANAVIALVGTAATDCVAGTICPTGQTRGAGTRCR